MKNRKILVITAFNKPWHNGWYMKAGFEKNGIEVIPFDSYSRSDTPDGVVTRTKEYNPDFVLFTKDEIPLETVLALKEHTKVIQWYPDPVIPEWLPPYVRAADIFFTMSEGLVDTFKEYNPHVFWLTQAFESSFFSFENVTSTDRALYGAEVSFVGNLGSKPQYLVRRSYLQRIIQEGLELRWWGDRIPRKFSTMPLILGKLSSTFTQIHERPYVHSRRLRGFLYVCAYRRDRGSIGTGERNRNVPFRRRYDR
jgi:hypothetical protein